MADIEKHFGKLLRRLRENKGLSQDAFADRAGIDRSYEGRIERGEVSISIRMMETISQALNVQMSDLVIALEKIKEEGNI